MRASRGLFLDFESSMNFICMRNNVNRTFENIKKAAAYFRAKSFDFKVWLRILEVFFSMLSFKNSKFSINFSTFLTFWKFLLTETFNYQFFSFFLDDKKRWHQKASQESSPSRRDHPETSPGNHQNPTSWQSFRKVIRRFRRIKSPIFFPSKLLKVEQPSCNRHWRRTFPCHRSSQ